MVDKNTSKESQQLKEYEIPIGDTYKLDARKKLGSGAFGDIYLGRNIRLNEEVAIKLEPTRSRHPQLFYESKLYMALQGGIGIPKLHWCGSQGNYNILIMDLLGPSLEDLFNYCKRQFTLLTTLLVVEQMLSRIEFIHSRNFIHRDVKPDNFLIGRGSKKNQIYAIDFGLAKRYRDEITKEHIPFKMTKRLTGTARYASIHALEEWEQSRRDDLESVGYVLMYFLRGGLPWQGLKIRSKEDRYKKILAKKKETSSEDLCLGFPDEFRQFVEYTRNLEYTEQPDYDRLKSSFYNLVTKKMGENFDFKYDWTTESDLKKRKDNDYIDLAAPSTNYPVSEKKSTQKEMSINSKKIIPQPVNSEKEGNNIIIDGQKENDNNFQSKCCTIF